MRQRFSRQRTVDILLIRTIFARPLSRPESVRKKTCEKRQPDIKEEKKSSRHAAKKPLERPRLQRV